MAKPIPQKPFPYEDSMEAAIQSVIDRNNQTDPTGKANELRIPPRRRQQELRRAKWYEPSQHAVSPYVSASISASPALPVGSPYTITVTIRHNENPEGNPNSKPVTFELSNLTCSVDSGEFGEVYPWLLLREDSSALEGGLKEIEAERDCHGPAVPWEDNEEYEEPTPPEICPQNGFLTLAVSESRSFDVQWKEPGRLVKEGERYQLCYRGTFLRWWRWETMEEMKGEKREEQNRQGPSLLWIACTNVVKLDVVGS